MLVQFGIDFQTMWENIAMGYLDPQVVMNGWMNSEGHKTNILNPNYTHIGVGFDQGWSNFWTQLFIGRT